MTEKPENDPLTSLFPADFYAKWRAGLKQMLISSLEANEKLVKGALAWQEEATSWSKDTPWAPLCKSFVTATEKIVEDASSLVCGMWHVEHARDGPEHMQKP